MFRPPEYAPLISAVIPVPMQWPQAVQQALQQPALQAVAQASQVISGGAALQFPFVRPPGPKDWSPRTGICTCRKGKHPCLP